ncbi:MAG: thioredoxin domain-containing protein [Gammaproteobacteria bacterium]|nr:thioredoxin domain-containing protein [Gammaproteobacteria bacterium]
MPTNRLAKETSPYLLKHAHNPVDWYAWGEEALGRARREGRPIHLSIGYSACWWCSVMERESFEDPDTAKLLNERFVNIKVDREERPDLDRIYQVAHQLLTRRPGGWPLTMFLAHDDQRPFFGGTYFPRESRHGLPGFRELLVRVADFYRDRREELRGQDDALARIFAELTPPPAGPDTPLSDEPLHRARATFAQHFDRQWGGLAGAPKFPHPAMIERSLRDWHATALGEDPDLQALYMATLTLRRMAEGGLYDQLGGGFCRYSVDEHWMIPHFEKMLYDNGALLAAYAQANGATGDAFYARIASGTAGWVLREMQSPEGGYFTSIDAQSGGHEGRFYVWDRSEVAAALTSGEYAAFARRFGLDREPNFDGRWHLHAFVPLEEIAEELAISVEEVERRLDAARARLLTIRNARTRPARDEKILASWNALMIRGMAIAARSPGMQAAAAPGPSLTREQLIDSASRSLEFLRATLWRNGRLLATARDGRAHLAAYLDDYAFLADAVLELQQARFRTDELTFMQELLEVLLEHFEDRESGGFFFTADDHEALIHRPKVFGDDAMPAGNGVAAFVLQRAGWLLGEPRYLAAAERALRAGWPAMLRQPQGHATLLSALEEYLHPPQIIVLRGEQEEIRRWQQELDKLYAPRRMVLAVPADAPALPPSLAGKVPQARAVAYLCRGASCSAPIASLSALIRDLRLGLATEVLQTDR